MAFDIYNLQVEGVIKIVLTLKYIKNSRSNSSSFFSVWNTCAGFRWMPLPYNECDLLAMAKETYIDFQPNTNMFNTLYINKMRQESEYDQKTT